MKHWLILVCAIGLEVGGTTCLKLSDGMRKPAPTAMMFILYFLSLGMMAMAVKKIDICVAYAIWSGLGTALIAGIGFFCFREAFSVLRLSSLVLVIVGVTGLYLSACGHAEPVVQ